MKRILFVDHTPFVGGAELALAEHIRHLDRRRFTPVVACTPTVPSLVERYRAAGAEVHFTPLPRLRAKTPLVLPRLAHAARALRGLVCRERIDLVVGNTSRASYIASLALAGGRVPLLWWVRDFDHGKGWFRLLGRVPRRIVCVSESIREFYGGRGERFPVVVVGNDLCNRLGEHPAAAVRAERARWGLEPEDTVIGFMGRLVEGKGPQDLVAAVAALAREYPRLRLLLVGTGRGQEGDVEERLRREVMERGLEPVVTFAGFQADEALYYQMFDVFAHTSRFREAMPTSAIQAMMAGKPVVATATGGTPEVVRHRQTGLLVSPGEPAALAGALRELLENPGLASTLASAGRENALARHREEVTTGQVEEIYDSVVQAGGAATISRA